MKSKMTNLRNTKEVEKEYAVGVTLVERKWGMFIFATDHDIYCLKCWDELMRNYEIYPGYNEAPVVVLLSFQYTCAECGKTIYPEPVVVIRKDQLKIWWAISGTSGGRWKAVAENEYAKVEAEGESLFEAMEKAEEKLVEKTEQILRKAQEALN